MGGPSWLYLTVAGLLAGLGLLFVYFGLFADRSRGRKRCPRCWYDMSAASVLTCPECGLIVKKPGKLHRTRRYKGRTALALVLLFLAAASAVQPHLRRVGWPRYLPDTAILWMLSTVDAESDPLWQEFERRVKLTQEAKSKAAHLEDLSWAWRRARTRSRERSPDPWRTFLRRALDEEDNPRMASLIAEELNWPRRDPRDPEPSPRPSPFSEEIKRRYGSGVYTPELDQFSPLQREILAKRCATLIRKARSFRVREQCFIAIQVLGPEGDPAALAIAERLRDRTLADDAIAIDTRGEIGEGAAPVVPILLELLQADVLEPDWRLLGAIESTGKAATLVVPHLVERLDPERWDDATTLGNQLEIISSLGNIGPAADAAVPKLLRGLEAEDEFVRWSCVEALGGIGPASIQTAPRLIQFTEDEEYGRFAIRALSRIEPDSERSRQIFLWAACHSSERLQQAGIEAFSQSEDRRETVRRLGTLLAGVEQDRLTALRGLALIRDPPGMTVDELAIVLQHDPSSAVRYEAVLLLKDRAEQKSQLAVDALDDALYNGDATTQRVVRFAGWRWEVWLETPAEQP